MKFYFIVTVKRDYSTESVEKKALQNKEEGNCSLKSVKFNCTWEE